MLLEGLEGCLIWDIPAFFSSSRLFSFIRVNSYGCLISDAHRTYFRIFLFSCFSSYFLYFLLSLLFLITMCRVSDFFHLFFVRFRAIRLVFLLRVLLLLSVSSLLRVFCRSFMSCGFVSCLFVSSPLFVRFLSLVFVYSPVSSSDSPEESRNCCLSVG
jgi:hypothetical protein